MLKDTKSLGNNKASAWESRGFVIKKEGMHFDTPSFADVLNLYVLLMFFMSVKYQLLTNKRDRLNVSIPVFSATF